MAAQRAYGGISADQRREQRHAALLDAALEIIGTQGFAKMTVAGLCAEAGLNERYFYESFTDRDAVATEVFDRVVGELADAIVTAVAAAPDDSKAKSRAAITAAVELLTDDPRKARFIFVEAIAHRTLSARRSEVMRNFSEMVLMQAQHFYGPEASFRVGDRAHFAAVHLVGGLFETMNGWLNGDLNITRDELIERSTDLFVVVGEHVAAGA